MKDRTIMMMEGTRRSWRALSKETKGVLAVRTIRDTSERKDLIARLEKNSSPVRETVNSKGENRISRWDRPPA